MKSKLKLWFKASENRPVAQRQPWLYVYVVVNLLTLVYSYIMLLHTQLPEPTQSLYFSPSEVHDLEIQSLIFTAVFEIALMVYLVTAKNVKHLLVLLYVLLAFNIIALPDIFFFKPSPLRSAVLIVGLCLTTVMIKLLHDVKREDTKRFKASKSKKKDIAAVEPEGSKGWRVTRKVIRVLFRINTIFYGSYLLWAGGLLLQQEHDRLTVVRVFIPFVVLGILYIFPYYLLKGKQLVAYVGSFLLVTALTILSLHVPVHTGRAAPAYLSLPPHPDLFTIIIWAFFRLSPVLVVYGFLICFDATARWTKQIAHINEDKRAAVTIFWVLVFAGSLFLGDIVRTHAAPHMAETAPQQLVVFTSSKDKFAIGFPGQPAATNSTSQASTGNIPVPYTQYTSYIYYQSGQEKVYNVYAHNWPAADGGPFTGLDHDTLESSLESFANSDIAANQGKLVGMKSMYLYSGKKLAVEAQFTVYQQYYGNITEYDRVTSNGYYEYDIEASGISHADFEAFANTFQFIGPIIPDASNNTSANVTSGDPSQPGNIGNTANQPTDVPTDGSTANASTDQQNTDYSPTDSSTEPNGIPDNATLQLQ